MAGMAEAVSKATRKALARIEARLAVRTRAPAFAVLTVDFANRTITYKGQTTTVETDAVSLPIMDTGQWIDGVWVREP